MDGLTTQAWVCPEKGAKLVVKDIVLPPLTATQVEVDMEKCGLCHTDIHMRDNDWGVSNYPVVLGHEGIGKVRKVGDNIKKLKVGDIVGITWIRDSCGSCKYCLCGRENICLKGYQGLYLGNNAGCWGKVAFNEHGGCFSKVMRIEERFAIKVPDQLPAECACPLMCGGGTVYEPICDYVIPGQTNVGVIGIGGLGTAALKLAKLHGGLVTAFSRSANKKEGALKAGASNFVVTSDKLEVDAVAGTMDLIIDCTPATSSDDISEQMNLLAFNGTYVRVGIPPANKMNMSFAAMALIFTQKKIAGSIVTGTARCSQMLEVTKQNLDFMMDKENPTWTTQTMPLAKVNEALDTLQNGTNTGWRIILDYSTFQ